MIMMGRERQDYIGGMAAETKRLGTTGGHCRRRDQNEYAKTDDLGRIDGTRMMN